MNAIKPGLCNAADYMDGEPGSESASRDAAFLTSQAAGIALVCSLATDAVAFGSYEVCEPHEVSGIVSKLLFKCYDDLTVAVNLLDR